MEHEGAAATVCPVMAAVFLPIYLRGYGEPLRRYIYQLRTTLGEAGQQLTKRPQLGLCPKKIPAAR